MLAFCGFNGFGQFGCGPKRSALSLEDFSVDELRSDGKLLIAPSWSYVAFARDNHLLLRGFLTNIAHSTLQVNTAAAIKQVAACDRFCLVLLDNGKVFKLLPRHDAELQEIKFDATHAVLPQKRSIFGERKPAEPFKITHIACGSNITVAISNTNAVFSVPSQIHHFPKHFRVQQLVCGFEHALLLSCNGDVYSWGNGLRGQLGQDGLSTEETPIIIEALAGIKITFTAAGGWHSAAISAFGDLYTWGFNSNGQLGLRIFKQGPSGGIKEPTVYPLPQVIDIPECVCSTLAVSSDNSGAEESSDCAPVKVFAGARHTVVQMSCGAIRVAGWNAHGQLGLRQKRDICDFFEKIDCAYNPPDIVGLKIVCNFWCTVLCS